VAATVWDSWNLDREFREASTRYAGMGVPVIVICGERDELLAESKRLATAMPHAQLVVVPNTGHQVQFTRTAIVLDAIRQQPTR
jgi:pimeloyl-ACP methyl ester carboxylesterase